jgi:hypothetical protein
MATIISKLMLCTIAGYVLALVFLAPAGPMVGAAQGFLVGALVVWGGIKAQKSKPEVSPVKVKHHWYGIGAATPTLQANG